MTEGGKGWLTLLLNRDAGSPETYTWFQSSSAKAVDRASARYQRGCCDYRDTRGKLLTPKC